MQVAEFWVLDDDGDGITARTHAKDLDNVRVAKSSHHFDLLVERQPASHKRITYT